MLHQPFAADTTIPKGDAMARQVLSEALDLAAEDLPRINDAQPWNRDVSDPTSPLADQSRPKSSKAETKPEIQFKEHEMPPFLEMKSQVSCRTVACSKTLADSWCGSKHIVPKYLSG